MTHAKQSGTSTSGTGIPVQKVGGGESRDDCLKFSRTYERRYVTDSKTPKNTLVG